MGGRSKNFTHIISNQRPAHKKKIVKNHTVQTFIVTLIKMHRKINFSKFSLKTEREIFKPAII